MERNIGTGNNSAALEKAELRRTWELEDCGLRNGPYGHETHPADQEIFRQREQQLREIDIQTSNLFNSNNDYSW